MIFRTGIRSSIPCFAIANRQFSDTTSTDVTDSPNERSPTISRSPLFSGKKVAAKRFTLSFDEYQKMTRKLRTRQRLAGLPFGVTALLASSCASAYMFPNMFDATPEQIQPILGMDPMIFCGLLGVASAGVGFVAGSATFKSLWRVWNKDIAQNLQEREADFLARISSRRASTYNKFEDDYYGENIKNVGDYRQWLREQQKKQRIADKYDSKEQAKSEVSTEAA